MSPAETSDLVRRLSGLVRVGKVLEVDRATARCKIQFGPEARANQTTWLPWLTERAGPVRTWNPPAVGEQVIILAQGGDPSAGVILPGAVNKADFPAPSDAENAYEMHLPEDGRYYIVCGASKIDLTAERVLAQCDDAKVELVPGKALMECPVAKVELVPGKATVRCADTVVELIEGKATVTADLIELNAPQTNCTGNLTVEGTIGAGGNISTPAEVTAGNIGLKSHKHGGVQTGGQSTTPSIP